VIEILLTPNQWIGYFPDSTMYDRMSDNILSGQGFSLSVSPPFKPTMFKEPLYSFFIALIKFLPFSNIDYVVFIQILLNPLIAVLIYFIGKEIFKERIARLSSLLVALIPVYGEISFFVMPEFIFMVLLFATILCLIRAVKLMNLTLFILSGLLLGLSSLCRNAALPLFLIYPIAILFKNRKYIKRRLLLNLAVFILSFLIMTVPWMIRNQQKLGLFSISRRGGELLSHQAAWAANFSIEEWKAYSLYLVSGKLAQRLYPQIIGDDFGQYEYRILMRTAYVDNLLKKYREGEVERILLHQAIKDIIHHPLKFLLLNLIIYVQTFKYFESIALMLINNPASLRWLFSSVRFSLFIIGLVYTLIAAYGTFHSKGFKNYLILATIIYFHIALTVIGIIPGGLQRYILPITVFYSFFVVIAIDKIRCVYS
jgi:4-amino-4-deoxy-L-arabinose transferase-like glycosyltransferase